MLCARACRRGGAVIVAARHWRRGAQHLVEPAQLGSATAACHADALHELSFSTDADVSPPLSMSTTFKASSSLTGIDGRERVYSRNSNPTRDRAEALLGAVEAAADGPPAHAILYASGLAATFAALARLMPERVAIAGGYHGTHLVLAQMQRLSGGRRCVPMPLPTPEQVAARLRPGDALWLETPRNPDCHVSDIGAYVAAARAVPPRDDGSPAVRVIVDGTFAPPPLQRPLALGADVVMHATTKYLSGHSDAMGGALCVSDAALAEELRGDRVALGSVPGQLEAWLLLRSLRTLHLRVTRQSETASALAAWLHAAVVSPGDVAGVAATEGVGEAGGAGSHPLRGLVHSVSHPSLPHDPSHEAALRQMSGGFGGCFALELTSEAAARALPSELRLFRDATSLGGVDSLIEWRRKYDDAISPRLLRVSVGLEEADHLRADLEGAIVRASRETALQP